MDNQPTIDLSPELKVKVNYKSLGETLAKAVIHGFSAAVGNPSALASSVSQIVGAINSIEIKKDAGDQAWHLIWLSMAWALSQVSAGNTDNSEIVSAIKDSIKNFREESKNPYFTLRSDFLDRPTNIEIYKELRSRYCEIKDIFGSPSTESEEEFAARLDAGFSSAFFVILSKNIESFNELIAISSTPGVKSHAFQLQWRAYKEKLIYDFEIQPMFGQETTKVSLSQAYVALRCHWLEENSSEQTSRRRKFAILDEMMDKWVWEPCPQEECVKLIGGGPGSGKSTSIKRLARTLAQSEICRPLLIPLQHIDLNGQLRDSINKYFIDRTNGAFTLPPLSREAIEDGPPLVLLFDGLDEIARPGEGADEIASLFITKLDQLHSALIGEGGKAVKIVVAGRMPSFQAARKYKGALGQMALEVIGYAPFKDSMLSKPVTDELGAIDQRPDWWSKMAPLFGLPTEVPQALSDQRLEDVTNEPLLSYLLVLSGLAVDKWEEAARNRNLIYRRLINEVWRRGWGDPTNTKNRQGAGKHLTSEQFNHLMETIALAAWLGGDTRIASDEKFKLAVKIAGSQDAWDEFVKDGGDDVTNLAMNFYLKSAEESGRGFEFTHKSFGDYLTARALIRIAEDVSALFSRFPDAALENWFDSTSTGLMTSDIVSYLRDQFRILAEDDGGVSKVQSLRTCLIGMCALSVKEGLPAHRMNANNWREIANSQKNSEISLWAVMNGSVRTLYDHECGKLVEVGFELDRTLLKTFLARVAVDDDSAAVIGSCLSHLRCENSDVFGFDLTNADFQNCNLAHANFAGTHLMHGNLQHCDLRHARFERSNLDNAKFANSKFDETNFVDARMHQCDVFFQTEGSVIFSFRSFLDLNLKNKNIPIDRIKVRKTFSPDENEFPILAQARLASRWINFISSRNDESDPEPTLDL